MSTFQTRIVNDTKAGTPGVNWGAPKRKQITPSPIQIGEKSLFGLKRFTYNEVSYEVIGMIGGGFNCWYWRGFIPWRGKAVSYLTIARIETGADAGKVRAFDLIHRRWNETWVVLGETGFFIPS